MNSFVLKVRAIHIVVAVCLTLVLGTSPDQGKLRIAVGDYLRVDYIKTLDSTRSPLRSRVLGTPQLLKIAKQEDGYAIQSVLDFNEGGPRFQRKSDGVLTLTDGIARNPEFEVVDSQHVRFGYSRFPAQVYCFVDSAEVFAARGCLLGQFVDAKMNRYVFLSDGTALFPSPPKKIAYRIGLHCPPSFTYDYFMTDSGEYAFQRHGDTLTIFNVSGGSLFEGGMVEKRPMCSVLRAK